jgi:uncharacterized coiled-coil DUF342 family protein
MSVKGGNRSEPSPTELDEEIQKLKTKTDEIDAEVKAVKKDVDEVKEKTKDIP